MMGASTTDEPAQSTDKARRPSPEGHRRECVGTIFWPFVFATPVGFPGFSSFAFHAHFPAAGSQGVRVLDP